MRFLLKSTINSCKDKKKVIWCSPNYREPELRSRALTKELALLTNQLTQDQYTVVIWGIKSFLRLVATNTNISKAGLYVIRGFLIILYTPKNQTKRTKKYISKRTKMENTTTTQILVLRSSGRPQADGELKNSKWSTQKN